MKRKIISLGIALVMILALVSGWAIAEDEEPALIIQSVTQLSKEENYDLLIEVKNVKDNANQLDFYSILFDGKSLELQSIESKGEPYSDSKTWLFFVDVSTVSSDKANKVPLVSTLTTLINDVMSEGDNAAIVTTAKSTVAVDALTSNKNLLLAAIEDLTKQDKDANQLYPELENAVDTLFSNCGETLKSDVRLVIISNGTNQNQGSTTIDKTQSKIRNYGIVIPYVISFTTSNDTLSIESLAYSSDTNGLAIRENISKASKATMISDITAQIQNREVEIAEEKLLSDPNSNVYVIRTSQPKSKDNCEIVVSFDGSMTGYFASDEIQSEDETKNIITRWFTGLKKGQLGSIAILVGIIVLIAGGVFLLLRQKHDKPDVDEPLPPLVLKVTVRESSGEIHEFKYSEGCLPPTGLTAGRKGDNAIVLPESDKMISRYHFVIKQDNDKMVLTNVSQTNGVRINGMQIDGPVELRQKDTIKVGDTEMTITWNYGE